MAVEKMKIISIVGKLNDLDSIARKVVLDGNVHMLNALSEINANYFELKASEDNIQAMQELSDLKPYTIKRDFSEDEEILKSFHSIFDMKTSIHQKYLYEDYTYEEVSKNLLEKYDTVRKISEDINKKLEAIAEKQRHIENISCMKNTGLDLGTLSGLRFVDFKLIMLSKENYQKLKLNFENVPSVVMEVSAEKDNVVLICFTPNPLREESIRIFESLNYKLLEIPRGCSGIAEDVIRGMNKDIELLRQDIEKLKNSAQEFKKKYVTEVERAYSLLQLEKKLEQVKSEVALGLNLFFLFGFVPLGKLNALIDSIKKSFEKDVIIITEDVENRRAGHSPPTKLKNIGIFRPFEALVSMYGTPCYNEMDPTPFFAISYMLLFGAMFGDLGQGFIILLGGMLLKYIYKKEDFGGILSRLGASSMFFGLLYGSIFGNEHIIHGLWIKPMENINMLLISAVALGVVLINIGYVYGLINLYQRKDIEEGLFGKEGLAGLIFFWVLLLTVLSKATGSFYFSMELGIFLMLLMLLLMVFKQPLAHLIKGSRVLYEESPADYYIEAGFGIIETLLSILSNVISFIRVGAFALNHVGLYIAFATMAEMINSSLGGILVLILGNVVIIGLEGLIVFIQSLRLEYYELFSKYYSGYGVIYKPTCIGTEIKGESI
ncbi:MAG: V-type ATP synthase subunit I [Bacillota bacterium]